MIEIDEDDVIVKFRCLIELVAQNETGAKQERANIRFIRGRIRLTAMHGERSNASQSLATYLLEVWSSQDA